MSKSLLTPLSLLMLLAGISSASVAQAAGSEPAGSQTHAAVAAAPATGQTASAHPRSTAAHTKVYLLRGFMNVFSLGMDQLADELRQRNISADVSNHMSAASVADEAIADCKSGRVTSIVLGGHSLGASAAVSVAEALQQAGVRVALVVLFDPVVRTTVPSNVQLLKNYYISDGVGATVARGERFHGNLQNVDMKNSSVGHVSMANSPALHKQVVQQIQGVGNSRCM